MMEQAQHMPMLEHAAPAPLGRFERVVHALVAGGGGSVKVQAIDAKRARLCCPHKGKDVLVLVLAHEAARPQMLAEVAKMSAANPVEIVLLGGSEDARKLLQSLRPRLSNNKVGLVHLDDQLALWSDKSQLAAEQLAPVAAHLDHLHVDRTAWDELLAASAQARGEYARHEAELATFSDLVKRRKPIATWGLVAVIGAVFGIELALGGSELQLVHTNLGSLDHQKVYAGEWWRLISCTFMHAGWAHVLLNTFSLLVLGSSLERIIGSARFILLYALSAMAGSLASLLFLKGDSVGASGAVWGIMCAHGIMAYRSTGLLPEAMIPGARSAAKSNLLINVLYSLRPHIDVAAHFGGGIGGALLMVSGALTYKLPRLGELEQAHVAASAKVPTSRVLWVLAGLSSVLLLAGPVLGVRNAAQRNMLGEITLVRSNVTELGVSALLPVGLKRQISKVDGGAELLLGDGSEALAVGLLVMKYEPLSDDEMRSQAKDLITSLEVPKDSTVFEAPREFKAANGAGLYTSVRYASGVILERVFVVSKTGLYRVELVRRPEFKTVRASGLARKIVESAQPLAP